MQQVVARTMIKCDSCGRKLEEGDTAWESEWKVIDTSGSEVQFRTELRYTCDPCVREEMSANA
jgi:hypothetical protein